MNTRSKFLMVGTAALLIASILAVTLFLLDRTDAQTPIDLRTVTGEMLDELRGRFGSLQSNGLFIDIARLHGDDRYGCPHERPEFLAWHRAYLIAFENALGVMVPYWDWTEQVRLPQLDEETYSAGQRNPLNTGFIYDSANGGLTSVLSTRQWQPLDAEYLAMYAYRALTRDDFTVFQRELEAVHATVHNQIGGTMIPVKTAAFDPIFWFHHSFVNIMWSMWADLHPNSDLSGLESTQITNFDLQGRSATIGQAAQRNVKFPHNRVYREAAKALNTNKGRGLNFAVLVEDAVQGFDKDHLILYLRNVTSPVDSENFVVQFQGKRAGYTGLIGMSHRMHPGMQGHPMPCHDRVIDLTMGYRDIIDGHDLDAIKECMTIERHNLNDGTVRQFENQEFDLKWETY